MIKRNTTSKKATSKNVVKSATVAKAGKAAFKSDARQTASLVKAGRIGAANAIRASRALGLPITYMQDGNLYREFSDGTKEMIAPDVVKKAVAKKTTNQLRKGMVLHARK